MALIFWDSFDHYADGDKTEKWSSYTASYGSATVGAYGRNGTNGLRVTNTIAASNYVRKALSTSPDTVTVGLAFRLIEDSVATTQIVALLDNTTVQVYLLVANDLSIWAYGGGVLRGQSAPGVITHNVYHYIELQTVIDNAVGSIEVKVDDVTVINLTNIDTQSSGTAQVTQIEIGGRLGSGYQIADFDDIYVCDDTGATCNDFLGDTRVIARLPDGAGAHADFTPLVGPNNWQDVNQNPPDGDTTYNSSATVTDRDSFPFEDLPAGIAGTVHAVCAVINSRKDDAGTRTLEPSVRVGGTDYDGTPVNIPETYAYHNMYAWELNPDIAGAWTVAVVNALESGYELAA